MANIELRTQSQILGPMIARFLAETDVNDLNAGSLFTLMFEAAASSDFIQEGKLLQLLKIRNVDKAGGVDLENLAREFGLEPSRLGAEPSTVFLTIGDSGFNKISSKLSAGESAPVRGDERMRIVDGSSYPASGTVYVGRGTSTSEVVNYSAITDLGTSWELTLTSALEKDHFVNEEVVLAQGGDRTVSAGTIVQTAGRSGVPPVLYSIQADVDIPDGENLVDGVRALAEEPGASGNVGAGLVNKFATAPFATATVINEDPATGGRDAETDVELRQRVKDHVHSLGKGTQRAIIRAVTNVSANGKRVITAFLREPVDVNDIAVLYIDDGTGFEPEFSGVGEEVIIFNADGTEQFFQLQQWPLVKAQLASVGEEPFNLQGGEALLFEVDGITEEQNLTGNGFNTPGIVSAQEVVEEINDLFTTIEARAKDGKIFVTPIKQSPEYIRAGAPVEGDDANTAIRFPTTNQYTIRLYKNDVLLNQNGLTATIQSFPNNEWPPFSSSETLQLSIDGIDSPLITFTDADFAALTSSSALNGASPLDWETVLNAKIIGITAEAQDDGTFTITSNKGANTEASLSVIGGSLAGTIISTTATSTGAESEFAFNRLSGQIELAEPLAAGDELKAGSTDTFGFAETSAQATYDLSASLGTPAKMVLVANADDSSEILPFAETLGALTFSSIGGTATRMTGAAGQFENIQPEDWVHLYNMPQNGIYKVFNKANDDSYVDFYDPAPQVGSDTPDGIDKSVKFFRTKGMVQEVTFDVGAAITAANVVTNFDDQTIGITTEIQDSGAIRIATKRMEGSGALFIPSFMGNARNLGVTAGLYPSNDPHVAAAESGDLLGVTRNRLILSPDLTDPYDTALGIPGTFPDDFSHNAILLPYLGSTEDLIRTPLIKNTSSNLTLRDEAPFQVIGLGGDAARYAQAGGVELGENDNMVFIIDDNAAQKTYDVPMYVEATIAGPAVPSVDEFDALGDQGDLLGSGNRWIGHRFEDYRVWFKAKTDLTPSGINNDIRITSQLFGPNGENILVGVFYPTTPDTDAEALFTLDEANDDILVNLILAGGTERVTGITTSQEVFLDVSGPVGGVYTYRYQFLDPVDLGTVVLGDIISSKDGAFSLVNREPMVVTLINNFKDSALSYEHRSEDQSSGVAIGGNLVTALAPSDPFIVGDRVEFTSITKPFSVASPTSVTVPTGGAYAAGGGTIDINLGNLFTYASYDSGTGVFSGVSPDPSVFGFSGGEPVTQQITPITGNVTVVNGPQDVDLDAAPADGNGYDFIITHRYLFANASPSFAAAIGDKIQVAGQVLTIDSVIAPDTFDVDNEFTFTGAQPGVITRLIIEAERAVNGVSEDVILTSSDGIEIFELAATTAQELIDAGNQTAGVQDLILLDNAVGNDGSGDITLSTADELLTGEERIRLAGGESYVYSSADASPAIRLKKPMATAPELGETIRLIPSTPLNIRDHFRKKQISGLAVATDIDLVNGGRRVQIKSKVTGGEGQVYAVGGTASGNSAVQILNTGQAITPSRGVVTLDRSIIDLVAPGHTVKLSQTGRARKTPLGTITAATSIEIQPASGDRARMIFGEPLAEEITYTPSPTILWAVRKLSNGRIRFEVVNSLFTNQIPATLEENDWVLVGNGSTLIGVTPLQIFSSANQGYFQIRETDGSTYFDVDNEEGTEEIVEVTGQAFLFMPYHSAMINDQIVMDGDSPLSANNRGTFIILDVINEYTVEYTNANATSEGPYPLGTGGVNSVRVLDNGYVTYRTVESVAPNPLAPTEEARLVVSPGFDLSLLNENQGAVLEFPNKLNYPADPVPGVSGYQHWIGLKQAVQRTVDGYEPNPITYPGVKAAGVFIEAREPQIQRVAINIKIKTKDGVALASVADAIKSNIVGFINNLGLGQDVILSEVVAIAQESPGVESVVLSIPQLEEERITINDQAHARTSSEEIVLS